MVEMRIGDGCVMNSKSLEGSRLQLLYRKSNPRQVANCEGRQGFGELRERGVLVYENYEGRLDRDRLGAVASTVHTKGG